MDPSATVRGIQGVIRRMKFAAPGITSVRAVGVDDAVLCEAAAAEDLAVSNPADAEIHWRPGESVSVASGARVVAVIAWSLEGPPPAHTVAEGLAKNYIPLREWVRGWFPENSVLGRMASGLLVSPAVGDRPTKVTMSGQREWIFCREPVASASDAGSALKKMAVTGFGCGFFPIMPATLASAALVPAGLGVFLTGDRTLFLCFAGALLVLTTVLSVALEKWAGRWLMAEDPREFVLDEFAGLAAAWLFIPPGAAWWSLLVAFFFFRFFDIFKWGVHWVEKLPVPGKIVWDDVLAGLYAGAATWLVCRMVIGH